MHGPAQYADQLLSRALVTLATAPGDVRSRILEAYASFHPLTTEHFPENLREDFEWVMKKLTRHPPRIDYLGRIQKSSVEVSLERMQNSTGVKIAQKLVQLQYAVDAHVHPR